MKKAYVKHISVYCPNNYEFNNAESRITEKVGVYRRPISLQGQCASDLALEAANLLFEHYKFDKNLIDALILCTETPDYIMPSTACILHSRIGLKESAMAFDYNHGCSGYIYGLVLAKSLIESGQVENVLLITADTLSKLIHPRDMRTRPLFGDAATATLIASIDENKDFIRGFQFGVRGNDYTKIIVAHGGMRMKHVPFDDAIIEIEDKYGNVRTDATLYMDGKSVVQFTIAVVPAMMKSILEKNNLTLDDIDHFVFHQANKFMLENLRTYCKIPDDERFFNDCKETGNTSSSTIPIALKNMLDNNVKFGSNTLVMGFGVGLSWGGGLIDLTRFE